MQHAGPSYAAVASKMYSQRFLFITILFKCFCIHVIFHSLINIDIVNHLGQLVWSRREMI